MTKLFSRRNFMKLSAGATLGLALSGCTVLASSGRTIKIGFVSTHTGPLAGFGEVDTYIIEGIKEVFGPGLVIDGATHPVEILLADGESNPQRAGEVALDLILNENIDLMLTGNTPEIVNPVSSQCELNQIPCISSLAPWQPVYFRRPDVPAAGYNWTYHFFWGSEDMIQAFLGLWESLGTNKIVGGLWPNDSDGLALSDPDLGFPPALISRGFKVIDPGRYENLSSDFTSQITRFKEAGVEIVIGVMLPPDAATFLLQADQQGFKPPVITMAKAVLFPGSVEAIPHNLGDGLTSEIWWSPNHPFKSSLSNITAATLAANYQQDTGKQWTPFLGFVHALFEVAADVLARAGNVDDKHAIVSAIRSTNLDTIVGPVSWGSGPTPNVTTTPLVVGQWGKGEQFPWEITVTNNTTAPNIPTGGSTRLLPG